MKARIDPDEYDLSQLRETVESPGYRLIREKLATTYGAELKQMATVDNWENTRFRQGLLAGLDLAASLPSILEKEIKARAARKAKVANAVDS